MSLTAYFLATLAVLPAFGLATWAWWSLGRLIADEGLVPGFEHPHHDRQAAALPAKEPVRILRRRQEAVTARTVFSEFAGP